MRNIKRSVYDDHLVHLADLKNLRNETSVPCRDTDLLLEALAQIDLELGRLRPLMVGRVRPYIDAVRSLCILLSPLPPASGSEVFCLLRQNLNRLAREANKTEQQRPLLGGESAGRPRKRSRRSSRTARMASGSSQ
jgi:hypothetical protein